jgi:polysaccharide export outer membrane protein
MLRLVLFSLILVFGAAALPAQEQGKTPDKELTQYVRDAQKAGLKDAEIQQYAVKSGWPEPLVKEAIEYVHAAPKAQAAKGDAGPATLPAATPPVAKSPAAAAQAPVVEEKPALSQPAPATAKAEPKNPAGAEPEHAGSVKPTVPNRGVPDEYRIGEGDVLAVSVWGEPSASVGSVVVRPDGMISMPLIKDVHVSGLSPADAEKLITELLSKQIRAADVTVIVAGINSKKVFFVGGGIKKEGPIPYTYRMTIMQGISEAGGLSDYAKRKKIYVLRNENGRQYKLPFDYDAVLKGEHMELNLPLLPGDTIVVPNH